MLKIKPKLAGGRDSGNEMRLKPGLACWFVSSSGPATRSAIRRIAFETDTLLLQQDHLLTCCLGEELPTGQSLSAIRSRTFAPTSVVRVV
jgi:hypothetical protein